MTALCRQSKNKEENHFSHEIFASQKQTGKTRRFHKVKAKKGLKKVLAWGTSIVCMLAMVLAGSPMTQKHLLLHHGILKIPVLKIWGQFPHGNSG